MDELHEDGFTSLDLESGVLTGTIVQRQRDRRTGERKFVIRGKAIDGRCITVVAKLPDPDTIIVLTVYASGSCP